LASTTAQREILRRRGALIGAAFQPESWNLDRGPGAAGGDPARNAG